MATAMSEMGGHHPIAPHTQHCGPRCHIHAHVLQSPDPIRFLVDGQSPVAFTAKRTAVVDGVIASHVKRHLVIHLERLVQQTCTYAAEPTLARPHDAFFVSGDSPSPWHVCDVRRRPGKKIKLDVSTNPLWHDTVLPRF